MQPLLVEIERSGPDDKPNPQYLDEEYKGEPRKTVRVRMRVVDGPYAGDGTEDNPPGKIWGKHGFTLGKRKNGESSMLRQLVMAATGISDEEALHDFDLDQLPGHRLIVIGRYDENDTERVYLSPIAYSRATPDQLAATAAPAAPAAASNGYQISPDGKYRWKEGMANWEPIPAAPPPPPPPAASAGPPPPPAPTAAPPPPSGSGRADF